MNGRINRRPSPSKIPQTYLKGEIYQDGQGHVFLAEALVQQFEIRDRVIRLKADFSDEVDDDDGLYVSEFENPDHGFVDLHYSIALLGFFLALQERETDGYYQVTPSPNGQIASERPQSFVFDGNGAEPSVGKIGGVEG